MMMRNIAAAVILVLEMIWCVKGWGHDSQGDGTSSTEKNTEETGQNRFLTV